MDMEKRLQGGVSLTQFAPGKDKKDDPETPNDKGNTKLTFEQKMEERAKETR
jgi:hypothetical protein